MWNELELKKKKNGIKKKKEKEKKEIKIKNLFIWEYWKRHMLMSSIILQRRFYGWSEMQSIPLFFIPFYRTDVKYK